MKERNERHRPLLSGIRIQSRRGLPPNSQPVTPYTDATLTGLAYRPRDKKLVLVTNLHVMTGTDPETGVVNEAVGDEEMYQPVNGERVANRRTGVPLSDTEDNAMDIAVLELLGGVAAESALHDHPVHTGRRIVPGVVVPEKRDPPMELLVLGVETGERTFPVTETNARRSVAGKMFTGLTILNTQPGYVDGGDSASPVLAKDENGDYHMAGVVFARNNLLLALEAYVIPASRVEEVFGITFGNTPPTANAGADKTAYRGQTVELNGSGSDLDGDTLTYSWEQLGLA